IFRRRGEDTPSLAFCYNNLAFNLTSQGNYAQAQPLYEKALTIRRNLLGDEHPETAISYTNLASNLSFQGKHTEAERQATRAVAVFEKGRLRLTPSALDRAARTGKDSPFPLLAVLLIRNGKHADAWERFEQGLARSTLDELASRLLRPAA